MEASGITDAVGDEYLNSIYVDRDSIHKYLKSLDITKGPGPDSISPFLLEMAHPT